MRFIIDILLCADKNNKSKTLSFLGNSGQVTWAKGKKAMTHA